MGAYTLARGYVPFTVLGLGDFPSTVYGGVMSTPPPVPLPIRVAIRGLNLYSRFGLTGWDISDLLEGDQVAEWEAPYELRKLHAVYVRTPVGGGVQDAAITTHHFINLTGGEPDADWVTADYTQVENAFTTMWGAIKINWPPSIKLQELRWYADGPAFKPFGDDPSPMLRATTVNVAGTNGTAGSGLPPQCAVSVTEVTASRYSTVAREGRPSQLRHRWGRFYLPAPAYGSMGIGTTEGRLSPAFQTGIANAVETFYNTCRGGNNLIPVMYSPTTGNAWSVDEIHVDDIFDVVRSRRYEGPLSRAARVLV